MAKRDFRPRSFRAKFQDAFRGLGLGIRGQSSFVVHFVFTFLVLLGAVLLGINACQWCLLILSITIVLAAELFNSALEMLAKAVDEQHNEQLGAALDIASAAVLMSAIGAAIVGLLIFVPPLLAWFA